MIYPNRIKEDAPMSEKILFSALANLPDEDFTVFYNQEFIRNINSKENYQYEIDFIVIDHRDGIFKSLLVLEVKGGTLKYNALNDIWLQSNREMQKSPITQVTEAMHSFLNRYRNLLKNVNVSWALAFPDTVINNDTKLPPNLPYEKIFDYNKIDQMEEFLVKYFDYIELELNRSGDTLNKLEILKDHLLVDCDFFKPLQQKNIENNNIFIKLTKRQAKILRAINTNQNVLVQGTAGSGKTLLAYQKATELKQLGYKVLFVTFNKAIATHLKNILINETNKQSINELDNNKNLEITNFHIWCKKLAEKNETFDAKKNDPNFFNTYIPNKALEIIKKLEYNDLYDAIIVDEGQDFRENWLDLLNRSLKPEGNFLIFMDENQDIFNAFSGVPNRRQFTNLELEENCRNTKSIITFLTNIITVNITAMEDSPLGEKVEYHVFNSAENQIDYIDDKVKELISSEKIQPKDMVIIVNNIDGINSLGKIKELGGIPVKSSFDKSFGQTNDTIFYTYINTYKGLESDIVFLLDTQNIDTKNHFYTQASRAKNKLYVCSVKN